MKKRRSIVKHLCLLAVCLLTSAFTRAARNTVPVYLVAGQSNTDGRVPNSELPSYIQHDGYKHCYWSYGSGTHGGNGQFELFRPRIFNKNMPGRWAYDAVTFFWLEKSLHRDFYVVKESLGGTAIDLHAKSKKGYEIKALIWHQGETDKGRGDSYYDNMKGVIDYVRTYLVRKTGEQRYASLPVILGGIPHKSRGYDKGVEQAKERLASTVESVYYVPVDEATLRSDHLHFDAAGTELLGRRLYSQLAKLGLAGKKLGLAGKK